MAPVDNGQKLAIHLNFLQDHLQEQAVEALLETFNGDDVYAARSCRHRPCELSRLCT